jgi:hypothetical protein
MRVKGIPELGLMFQRRWCHTYFVCVEPEIRTSGCGFLCYTNYVGSVGEREVLLFKRGI